jgi:signal transduction histidine kinase
MTFVVSTPRRSTTTLSRAPLIAEVLRLRARATALADGQLQTRVGAEAANRRDELGALGREFDRVAGRIEALVAGQRRLLSDVSHELRSPLTRMRVGLSLARQHRAPIATL